MPNPKIRYEEYNEFYLLKDNYDKKLESQISSLFTMPGIVVVPGKPGLASMFSVGDKVVIKDKTFKVVYVNESFVGFEPVSIIIKSIKEE